MISRTFQGFRDFMKRQKPNFRVLVIRGAFTNFRWGLTQNYTSVYTVELGADPVQLGSLSGVGSLVNAFLSAPVGWLADRYSLKKIWLFGLILETLVPLGYALSQSWQMLIFPVSFFYMTFVTAWMIERVLLANALRHEDRATGFGVLSSISQIPMIFAPTLAGLIVTWLGGISVEAIRPLFYISFGISAIMSFWVYWNIEDPGRTSKLRTEGFISGFRRVLTGKGGIKRWLFIELLGSFTFGSTMPFIMVYAAEIKQADAMILGFMGSAMTIVSMISSVPLGKLADRIGRKRTILLLRPVLYVSYLLLVWAPRPEFL
ncbi:MAG: MFS transporter, partial [Candidatus Bathyarchaeia archaeon]